MKVLYYMYVCNSSGLIQPISKNMEDYGWALPSVVVVGSARSQEKWMVVSEGVIIFYYSASIPLSDFISLDPASADSYALGLLLHSVFNPSHPPLLTAEPPHSPPPASSRGAIPTAIFPTFKKLLNPNPKGRLSAKAFLEMGMAGSGFFSNNRLVIVCAGLDNFALASEAEKNQLLR